MFLDNLTFGKPTLVTAVLLALIGSGAAAQPGWQRGPEGQRRADLGDGTYLNPVLPGDRPDPRC